MHQMMDFQLWKQRREELLHEAQRNRHARALRATRKRRAGRIAALVWEIKRHVGRLFKLLSAFPDRTVVEGYPPEHETTYLCASP